MTTTDAPVLVRTLESIELAKVVDNPWQPRANLATEQIQQIADSIREVGLLQVPLVRPAGDVYQVAFGHYRIAALKHLGIESYDLEVRELTDAKMAIIALTENAKRKEVAPIEQYRAWQKALEIDGMTVSMLAESMGLDRSTVSNNLRLLKLPDYVLEHVDAGVMSAHAAREFLCLLGIDGHFHDDTAKAVISKLTTGTPDWRAVRVRWLIQQDVEHRPVAEWRMLYKVDPNERFMESGLPSFDIDGFKPVYIEHVHSIPDDEYDGHTYSGPTNTKLKRERSRDWTCATKEWAKAQAAGKKAAAAVAEAAPGASAKPSADFTRTLANDPVYKSVSPETAGPLMKTRKKNELNEEAVQGLGTRAAPVELKNSSFKAYVGEATQYWNYGTNVTVPPSYFDDINECRKTCTIGATYAQFKGKPLHLFCLNEDHFNVKLAAGTAKERQKIEKKAKERDEKDALVYRLVDGGWTLPPVLMKFFAAQMLGRLRAEPVNGSNAPEALIVWRANTRRLFGMLDQKPNWWFSEAGKEIDRMNDAEARELLCRVITEHLAITPLEKVREAFGAKASRGEAPAS